MIHSPSRCIKKRHADSDVVRGILRRLASGQIQSQQRDDKPVEAGLQGKAFSPVILAEILAHQDHEIGALIPASLIAE